MKIANQKRRVLPSITLVSLGLLHTGLHAGEVFGFDLRSEGDVLRLQLESEPDTLIEAALSQDGSLVVLTLKNIQLQQVQGLIDALKSKPGLVRSIALKPTSAVETQLILELSEAIDLLDETIASSGPGRSAWELVLGRYARLRELAEVQWRQVEQEVQLLLRGGPDLQVQVSVQDQPPVLLLDFPALTPEQVGKVVQGFKLDPRWFKDAKLQALAGSGSRWLLSLSKPWLLNKSPLVQTSRDSATILVSARPAPDVLPDGVEGVSVQAIRSGVSGGFPVIELEGAKGIQLQTTRQAQPAALLVEVSGVSAKRSAELLAEFKSGHPDILGARLGPSSSVQSVWIFDLLRPLAVDPLVVIDDSTSRVSLALGRAAPATAAVAVSPAPIAAPTNMLPAPQRADRGPMRQVKPVTLDSAHSLEQPNALQAQQRLNDVGLMQALDLALQSDPKYLAARQEFIAASEAIPQARAGYLPTATFDYQRNNNNQSVTPNATGLMSERKYPVRNAALTITQPIIKLPALFKMKQAEISVEQAKAVLLASEQDQMIRLASAYLNMLAAQDALTLARAEREATAAQYQSALVRARSGLGTSTQLYETEGRLALTQSKEVEAVNNLEIARLALKEIIGVEVQALKPFSADFDPVLPLPAQPEPWVNAALEQNLSMQVSRMAAEIARLEVSRQTAAYGPSLNLVYSQGRANQGDAFIAGQPTPGFASKSNDISLRLSMPLFEGGMTRSLVRESVARLQKALQDRDAEALKTERLAKSTVLGLAASTQSIPALRKSLMAQESALETKLEGMKSGLFTNIQVVDAYRLMFAAKRDYLQARYDYLLNRIKLKQAIGSFNRQDLQELAELIK